MDPLRQISCDSTLSSLYKEAKHAISELKLDKFLERFLINMDAMKYSLLYKICKAISKKLNVRVIFCLPCGHVVIDTCKGCENEEDDGNTFDNYLEDRISENHNTRVSIFQAQFTEQGVGYERKYSSELRRKQVYLAIRIGPYRNSFGTICLSRPT